jgi:ribosomal protein L37AE/L43A
MKASYICSDCGQPVAAPTLYHNMEYFGLWVCNQCLRQYTQPNMTSGSPATKPKLPDESVPARSHNEAQ